MSDAQLEQLRVYRPDPLTEEETGAAIKQDEINDEIIKEIRAEEANTKQ